VALGDSFSAGEGNSPYDRGTENGCHRSSKAFPRLIDPRVVHRACTGATIDDVREGGQFGERPQLDALGPGVTLVTITIGGNDIRFREIAEACFGPGDCVRQYNGGTLEDDIDRRISQLPLTDLYAQIADEAPNARILIVSYPVFIPEVGPDDPNPCADEAWVSPRASWISVKELQWMRAKIERLNDKIRESVRAADSLPRNVEYVDASMAFEGKELCADGSWMQPPVSIKIWTDPTSLHPTEDGQEAIKRVVSQKLASPAPGGGETAVGLVLDVSGSMGNLPFGPSKLDAAVEAANRVVTLVKQDSEATGIRHRMALVVFSSRSETRTPLTDRLTEVESSLRDLQPLDATDLGAGIEAGIAQLAGAAEESRILIVLSDGQPTAGLSAEEILAGPVPEAKAAGIAIYTVGFTDSIAGFLLDDIDEDLLRAIAEGTGGTYELATTPWELERFFIRSRMDGAGTILGELTGTISQGQEIDAGTFSVSDDDEQLQVVLTWPGSDLDAIITDPAGATVSDSYPGASLFSNQEPEYVIVEDPLAGIWSVATRGVQVNGAEEFAVLISARRGVGGLPEEGTTHTFPALALIAAGAGALTVGLGAGVVVLMASRTRARGRCPNCSTPAQPGGVACTRCAYPLTAGLKALVVSGQQAGREFVLRDGDIVGRDLEASVQLLDPEASRRHAVVRWEGGDWTISDLGSTAGIYRNGEQIVRGRLRAGDVIRLGATEMLVEQV
jgi:lysophospholipase L1-like esterase